MFPDYDGVTNGAGFDGMNDMVPTFNPPNDIPNNGDNGSAVPFQQIQPKDGGNPEPPKTVEAEPQDGNQVPNPRDAFFQQRYDKLISTLKNNGIEIDPNAQSYDEYLNPLIQSHNYMSELKKNPNLLLEVAKNMFPNRFVEPNYMDLVKEQLDKEFGADFTIDRDEVNIFGTKSFEYNLRANTLAMQMKQQEMFQEYQQKTEAERQEIARQQQLQTEIQAVTQKYNIPVEETTQALEMLKNPDIWTTELLVNIGRLLSGKLRIDRNYVPDRNPENLNKGSYSGAPPSPANLSGNRPAYRDADFDEFSGY